MGRIIYPPLLWPFLPTRFRMQRFLASYQGLCGSNWFSWKLMIHMNAHYFGWLYHRFIDACIICTLIYIYIRLSYHSCRSWKVFVHESEFTFVLWSWAFIETLQDVIFLLEMFGAINFCNCDQESLCGEIEVESGAPGLIHRGGSGQDGVLKMLTFGSSHVDTESKLKEDIEYTNSISTSDFFWVCPTSNKHSLLCLVDVNSVQELQVPTGLVNFQCLLTQSWSGGMALWKCMFFFLSQAIVIS